MYVSECNVFELEKDNSDGLLYTHKIAKDKLSSVKNDYNFILYHLAADKFEIVQKLCKL